MFPAEARRYPVNHKPTSTSRLSPPELTFGKGHGRWGAREEVEKGGTNVALGLVCSLGDFCAQKR